MNTNTANMTYCPPNVTIGQVWLDHGWSPCFLDTVSVFAISVFLLIFGSAQLYVYRRYATRNETATATRLYRLQVALHALIPALELVRFMLLATSAYDARHHPIFGYQIVHVVLTQFVFVALWCLLHREHSEQLPATPSQGHGLVLLCAWTLVFCVENLQLIDMQSQGWVDLSQTRNRVELALFAVRYAMCLGVFALGLKAPGIVQRTNEEYDRLAGGGGGSDATNVR